MRYQVALNRKGWDETGFSIWDTKLSPLAVEEGKTPVFCSLDGQNELVFPRMGAAYRWLAECERAGLDMEAEGGDIFTMYLDDDGQVSELHVRDYPTPTGPAFRELPTLWRG